jgi:KDO2-lipid IV(A) lauroyltransferase
MAERNLLRRIRYAGEAAAVLTAFGLFGILSIDRASALGGWLGRNIGPHLGYSARARRNIKLAMPELTAGEAERIVVEMWDNLGRFLAEMPHLPRLDFSNPPSRVEILGLEHLPSPDDTRGRIFFSAHLANWEVMGAVARHLGIDLALVYRAANNPWVERMLHNIRGGELLPKGARGAREVVAALKAGRILGILVDQKMNDGIAIPFFGRPAMTAPAVIDLARKFGAPVQPVRIERLQGARFRVTLYPPMTFEPGPDRHADLISGMAQINSLLERWIRERPGQWLWLHRRWPES